MSGIVLYPKIYLSGIEVALSNPDILSIVKNEKDNYDGLIWNYVYGATVFSWSVYLWKLQHDYKTIRYEANPNIILTDDNPLFLSRRQVYGFYISGLGQK